MRYRGIGRGEKRTIVYAPNKLPKYGVSDHVHYASWEINKRPSAALGLVAFLLSSPIVPPCYVPSADEHFPFSTDMQLYCIYMTVRSSSLCFDCYLISVEPAKFKLRRLVPRRCSRMAQVAIGKSPYQLGSPRLTPTFSMPALSPVSSSLPCSSIP